jgi:hypothetical protein
VRALLLLSMTACLQQASLQPEIDLEIESVLVRVEGARGVRLFARTRQTWERDGLPLNLGGEDVLLLLHRSTLAELNLAEEELMLPSSGIPLPRAHRAYRIAIGDGTAESEPIDVLETAEVFLPIDRWFTCFANGGCAVDSTEQPERPACGPCDVPVPKPPLAPMPPLAPDPTVGSACDDWPELPPDTIFVEAEPIGSVEAALAELEVMPGAHPSRTLALEMGTHTANARLSGVRVVGRCASRTSLELVGHLGDARLEDLTLGETIISTASASLSHIITNKEILISGGSTVAIDHLQSRAPVAINVLSSSVTVDHARIEGIPPPPPRTFSSAFLVRSGSLTIRRAIATVSPNDPSACGYIEGGGSLVVRDFDCVASVTHYAAFELHGGATASFVRVKIAGTESGIIFGPGTLTAEDVDIDCGTATQIDDSTGIAIEETEFRGRRIRVTECRDRCLWFRESTFPEAMTDLELEDCEVGAQISGGDVELARASAADHYTGFLLEHGLFRLHDLSMRLRPESTCIDAALTEQLDLYDFAIGVGYLALAFGGERFSLDRGTIESVELGVALQSGRQLELFEQMRQVSFENVGLVLDPEGP